LIDRRGSDWNGNAEDTESIRTTMSSMDRHLKILIELFSEQMDKMMSAVADVRTAVITSNPDPSSSLLLTAPEAPVLLTSGRSSSVGNGFESTPNWTNSNRKWRLFWTCQRRWIKSGTF
jgi:hypothetical protein